MRSLRLACAFAVLATGVSQAAPISGIDIIGSTLGCFGVGCTPIATDTVGGLTFTGGSFAGQTDAAGEFAPGNTGNNLGTFSLVGTLFDYGVFGVDAIPFTLRMMFTAPSPGLPAGHEFEAAISGLVGTNIQGTLSVTWPGICHGCGAPAVFLYDFSVPQGDGTISAHINPLSFSLSQTSPAPQTAIQDGHFHTDVVNPIPEPMTLILLSGGLIALGLARRGRSRSS